MGISPALAPTLDLLQLDVANFATTIWHQVGTVWKGSRQHVWAPWRLAVFFRGLFYGKTPLAPYPTSFRLRDIQTV